MTPYDAYVMYLAMKRHFTSGYDYIKYNGKVTASVASFEKRRDRYMFHKLSKQADPMGLVVANMFVNPDVWVGDLFDERAAAVYNAMKRRRETLSYTFKQELLNLVDLEKALKVVDNEHPLLFKLYRSGKVSPETMIILNGIGKIFDYWSATIHDEYLWPEDRKRLENLSSFFEYDKQKFKKIFKEVMDELLEDQ